MTKRIEPNLQLGQINNLMKLEITKNILNHILLRNERDISVYMNQLCEAIICIQIESDELNEILGNMEYYYKKTKLSSKLIHREFIKAAPIHKNGCPLTYKEWIDGLIDEVDLSKEDKSIFNEWNNLIKIPYDGNLI